MIHRLNTAIGTACLTSVAFLIFTASLYPQDDSDKSKQPGKKAAETKKVDVRVKVSATDQKPIPAGSTVEISGQEPGCGSLNSNDARATVDDKGEAIFRGVAACKVTVKINLSEYLPVRKLVDLTDYRSCAGAAQPACEPVSLSVERLP